MTNSTTSKVLDQFEAHDLGAPFKVVLHDSVTAEFTATGEMVSYHIPDFDGLVAIVVMARLFNDRKLSGDEIKFLRKAMGLSQSDFARALGVNASTLSRVEAGAQVLGPVNEKWLRLYLSKRAGKLDRLEKEDHRRMVDELLDKLFDDFMPVAAHDASEGLTLNFSRQPSVPLPANDDEPHSPNAWSESQRLIGLSG